MNDNSLLNKPLNMPHLTMESVLRSGEKKTEKNCGGCLHQFYKFTYLCIPFGNKR